MFKAWSFTLVNTEEAEDNRLDTPWSPTRGQSLIEIDCNLGQSFPIVCNPSLPILEQDSIFRELKFGQFSATAIKPLLEIEGQLVRSSFSSKWHSLAISNRPSSPTKGTFHKERALREGQPRAIVDRPRLVTPRTELLPRIKSLPSPPRLLVPTAIAASLISVAFFPSKDLVRYPSLSTSLFSSQDTISTSLRTGATVSFSSAAALLLQNSFLRILLKSTSHFLETQAHELLSLPSGTRLKISKRHSSGRTSIDGRLFCSNPDDPKRNGALMRARLQAGLYTSTRDPIEYNRPRSEEFA